MSKYRHVTRESPFAMIRIAGPRIRGCAPHVIMSAKLADG